MQLHPLRAARLQEEHAAEIAKKDAEIATLTERLEIANRRLKGLMAEQGLGVPGVDAAWRKIMRPIFTTPAGLNRMANAMKLPVA